MAQVSEEIGDVKLIWTVLGWFFGGIATIVVAAVMALIGNLWKEHRDMKKDYDQRHSDESKKLEDKNDLEYKEIFANLKKLEKDYTELKHDFRSFTNQVSPILDKIQFTFEKEDRMIAILERMEKLK